MAHYVSPVFDAAQTGADITAMDAWVGAVAFSLQLYFDFSGYSDMAIGLSRMFGIAFPLNFNSPYKAASIIEFWRCWHMTLSRFLRDYIYIPMGGNRLGMGRRHFNLLITMVIGGFWHGAAWTFCLWGGLHGLALSFNHLWRQYIGLKFGIPKWFGWMITFCFVILAWVPFRSASFDATLLIWKHMFGLGEASAGLSIFPAADLGEALAWIGGLMLLVVFAPNTQNILSGEAKQMLTWKPSPLWGAVLGGISGICLAMIAMKAQSEFLYFRF